MMYDVVYKVFCIRCCMHKGYTDYTIVTIVNCYYGIVSVTLVHTTTYTKNLVTQRRTSYRSAGVSINSQLHIITVVHNYSHSWIRKTIATIKTSIRKTIESQIKSELSH